MQALTPRHQARIAPRSRGVDAGHAFGGEARQVMRPVGFGTGARQALAAERLAADHRADLVAVDVEVADLGARFDQAAGRVDPAATLNDWERRLNLWYKVCPVLDAILTNLRAVWGETEGAA